MPCHPNKTTSSSAYRDWDYTNYENSVKHLKEAGLNPALFYAKGGQGGATGGGQAQGVGLPSTTPTMAKIQAQGMGVQLQNVLSQIELNKATAKKTEAEAEKIAGADTKVAESEAEMLKSQSEFNRRMTKLQDSIEKLTNAQEQKTAAEYFYTQAQERKVWDYTNYENQVKHLKEAGLNTAPLYGQGGGSGSAAGGGSAAGVGLPSSTGVGMGIQWEQMEAQKELAKAQAAKTNAEAAKLMTTDTENVESNTEKNKQDIEESKKRIEALTSQIHKTNEESKGIEFNNYLNDLRKGITLQGEVNGVTAWTKGFDKLFKENELQKMLAEWGISTKEYYEAQNDKEIAMRLRDSLDEIANGKIAVFGKVVEEKI